MGLLFQTLCDNDISSYAIKIVEFGAVVPEIAPSFLYWNIFTVEDTYVQKCQRGPRRLKLHSQGLKGSLALAQLTQLIVTPHTRADSNTGARDSRHSARKCIASMPKMPRQNILDLNFSNSIYYLWPIP